MPEDAPERFEADVPFSDVSVPVHTRSQTRF